MDKEFKEKAKAFKAELKALLKKYDAEIWVDVNGDTHGVSWSVVVDIERNKTVLSIPNGLDHKDIK